MTIYKQWLDRKKKDEKSLAVLVDPDKVNATHLLQLINHASRGFIDYFFVGGSLLVNNQLSTVIDELKKNTNVPVILFPGSTLQVNTEADGILFLSLISGRNPELLIGKHVEVAPIIHQSNLEVIATGYMIIESGKATSASYMSNTQGIPYDKPEIAACTAMAGQLLGLQCNYLEAGSGAINSVSCEMISQVAKSTHTPLIVGGGIKDKETAKVIGEAGADILVIGTRIEQDPSIIEDIFHTIKNTKTISIESEGL